MLIRAKSAPVTIDEYLVLAPEGVRPILARIRQVVAEAVPSATECISHKMPAFRLTKIFLYFTSFKEQVGLYPPVSGRPALERKVARYGGEKGNLRFPLKEPMPYELIGEVAKALARKGQR
ncbi:MAG TPA: DUF1801 domain-containing protein [Thiobacillaceae bacterium]|nr:DUF1801 domain-containing protein [Thiobacillaceae bacterium]